MVVTCMSLCGHAVIIKSYAIIHQNGITPYRFFSLLWWEKYLLLLVVKCSQIYMYLNSCCNVLQVPFNMKSAYTLNNIEG